MTVDTLIMMLEEAKSIMPLGGATQVRMVDLEPVRMLYADKRYNAVIFSDYHEDENSPPPRETASGPGPEEHDPADWWK